MLQSETSLPQPAVGRPFGFFAFALLTLFLLSAGCNSFGSSKMVRELQSENERLLAEYRAQRDRNKELAQANEEQAHRLAESEKMLARLSDGSNSSRLSSLPSTSVGRPASNRPADNAVENEVSENLKWLPRPGQAQ